MPNDGWGRGYKNPDVRVGVGAGEISMLRVDGRASIMGRGYTPSANHAVSILILISLKVFSVTSQIFISNKKSIKVLQIYTSLL